ncbi:hypothetical protein M0208_07215 [Sphingomonas sp. SUN019]|uniref:hypothetical protein n=1 Tax=Sphingomonas sp. SUN019 TaxID=2937788 RepID=UPI0021644639|nr:hypothetical protein [Sphingomonas sp. SUN019]UVO50319.1 hypothetical protein M0208_07215 [Sphingomonas sp. SUN019]
MIDHAHMRAAMLAAVVAPSAAMTNAVGYCGGRLSVVGWDQVVDRMDQQAHDPIILLDAQGVSDEILASTLYRIDAIATARRLNIVAALSESQIDIVSAGLVGRDVQLLCTPGEADWVGALTIAWIADDRVALHDPLREGEAERLARLNEEVARIAEVLARLSRRDDAPRSSPGTVTDVRAGFTGRPALSDIAAEDVRKIIRARRLRDRFFGEGLFEDPAWDMILDLYAAHLARAQVSVSSLCIAAAVAPTTALRWIAKLTDAGLFERQPDPFDRRRAFMALSPRALDAMHRYVLATRDAGLPVA